MRRVIRLVGDRADGWIDGRRLPYLLLLPVVVCQVLVQWVPILVGAVAAFFEIDQYTMADWTSAPFTGLRNLKISLDWNGPIGHELITSLLITSAYVFCVVGLSWLLGLLAALLVNRGTRMKRTLRTAFLLPYVLPAYVTTILWNFIFQRDTGALNSLLVDHLHLLDDRPFWLLGGNGFFSLLTAGVWHQWPFFFLVFLAGLQSISEDYYEAATLDGASHYRKLQAITIPLLRPITLTVVLLSMIWAFNDFTNAYVLFGNSPPDSASVASLNIYTTSYKTFNIGLGSAMSLVFSVFIGIIVIAYLKVFNIGGDSRRIVGRAVGAAAEAFHGSRARRIFKKPRRLPTEDHVLRVAKWLGTALFGLMILGPLYVMVVTTLRPNGEAQAAFTWLPEHATLSAYRDMWHTIPFARYFVNSLIVTVTATVVSVILAGLAAYALSRFEFRFKNLFRLSAVSTQFFSGVMFLFPLLIIFLKLDDTLGTAFYQTRIGLSLTYVTFALPFAIWLLAGYFESIPRDLDEAARIDGCSWLGSFRRVVLPLAMPGVVGVAVLTFITAWNEMLFASALTNDTTQMLSSGMQQFTNSQGTPWNQVMAASLVAGIPGIIGFFACQRYLVRGLVSGAVK